MLLNPVSYTHLKTASYGHFGRGEFAWEDTNKVADIKDLAGKLGS